MRTKGAVTAKGEKKLGKKLGKNLGRNLGRSKTPKTPLSEEGSFRVCEAYPSPCPFRVLILSESLSFPSPYSFRVPVLSESLFYPSPCPFRVLILSESVHASIPSRRRVPRRRRRVARAPPRGVRAGANKNPAGRRAPPRLYTSPLHQPIKTQRGAAPRSDGSSRRRRGEQAFTPALLRQPFTPALCTRLCTCAFTPALYTSPLHQRFTPALYTWRGRRGAPGRRIPPP